MVLTNLLTVFLVLAGLYVSYMYISLIFDRVTHGDGAVMALLQSVWGVELPFIGVALILAAIVVQEVSRRRFKDLSYVT